MKVIGAGWGRTGTMSLKVALEILGLPCYHMVETYKPENKDHDELWLQAWNRALYGDLPDFEPLLSNYKAIVGWPGAAFYKLLMERYPDAKVTLIKNPPDTVILTTRDPAAWYKSALNSIWALGQMMTNAPWYVKALNPRRNIHMQMANSVVWVGELDMCFGKDPDKAKKMFAAHNEEVMEVVPADRLLVFEVSQGWGPLCEFLGKPVPQQPFPHVNDAKEWEQLKIERQQMVSAFTYGIPALAAAVLAGGALAVKHLLQQRLR